MNTCNGNWKLNIVYKVDDIVLKQNCHYICLVDHVSNNLVCPGHQEEIYWLKLNEISCDHSYDIEYINDNENTIEDIIKIIKDKSKKKTSNINKRKLDEIDYEISEFKKQKRMNNDISNLKDKLMLLNVDIQTKVFLTDKWDSIEKSHGSEYDKGKTWINTVINIPFGKYIPFKITRKDSSQDINNFFENVRKNLDKKIYGLDSVKNEIIEFLARKIANPNSKGHVLALHGQRGVGKSKLLKSLSEVLSLPFHQINFGGLGDVSTLVGHSETYVGAKPGKFVEILINSGCMNPIIFLDEIDKTSEYKSRDINGILTHLLDEEQNDSFQDHYLSNVNLDLSKVFFVIAFNDIEKVNPIVLNRMKVIHIDNPSNESKIIIAEKMIPDILKELNIDKNIYIKFDKELINYVISKIEQEPGVRQLKKNIEKIFNKLNYLILTGKYLDEDKLKITSTKSKNKKINVIDITQEFIDNNLDIKSNNESYLHMYM